MALNLFNKFHKSDFSWEYTKDVNMIFISTHDNWITLKVFANATKVTEQFFTDGIVDQRFSVFCTEDDVDVIFN